MQSSTEQQDVLVDYETLPELELRKLAKAKDRLAEVELNHRQRRRASAAPTSTQH
jgi:hypothetical protein